jgi:hypothetical protein
MKKNIAPRDASDKTQDAVAPRQRLLPDASSDEFAYLVATWAWKDGLTANEITRRIFDDSSPLHLMQVKRALKRAHLTTLKLIPSPAKEARDALDKLVNRGVGREITFHVVKESEFAPGAPVYVKAAELIVEFIAAAAKAERLPPASAPVVIGNAGGRTIFETMKAVARTPPMLGNGHRLLFVAGNAVYSPDKFQRSANFLSVSLAELFHAEHWAVPKDADGPWIRDHKAYIEEAALFICGAGVCHDDDHLGLMAQFFNEQGWEVPSEAVGDLAFNFLDRRGAEVEPAAPAREFMRHLNPSLSPATLLHIANRGRVLLILDAHNPNAKRRIGAAALRRRYATDVVLSDRLANVIVDELKSS